MIDDTYCPLCGSVVCPGDCDDRVRPRGPLPRWRDLFEASPAPIPLPPIEVKLPLAKEGGA